MSQEDAFTIKEIITTGKYEYLRIDKNINDEDKLVWQIAASDELFKSIEQLDVEYLMKKLTYQEQRIVKSRLEGRTLKFIARREDLSRERIRQIHDQAICKMKYINNLIN